MTYIVAFGAARRRITTGWSEVHLLYSEHFLV